MAPEDREREGDEWCVVKMEIANLESEIARLRADVERLREVLDEARTTCRRAAAMFVEIYGEDRSANERWCRATMEAITAALADTADKQGEQP